MGCGGRKDWVLNRVQGRDGETKGGRKGVQGPLTFRTVYLVHQIRLGKTQTRCRVSSRPKEPCLKSNRVPSPLHVLYFSNLPARRTTEWVTKTRPQVPGRTGVPSLTDVVPTTDPSPSVADTLEARTVREDAGPVPGGTFGVDGSPSRWT